VTKFSTLTRTRDPEHDRIDSANPNPQAEVGR